MGKVIAGTGFKSFRAMKKALGSAGKGQAWHHIVEQTPANIKKFGPEAIHNTGNVLKVANGKGSLHAKLSGYYSSKDYFTNGKTVRKWLSDKSFEEQYEFGFKVLNKIGGSQ
jgi:hypothetical protein